jgi:transcriptional regulator with XRE-family HTH domain
MGLEISQEGLAATTGLPRTYVGSVERGERSVSLQNIVVFARSLGVTPSDPLQDLK